MSLVTCRICKEKFDKDKTQKDEYWVMPSKNWYYHKKCYEDWRNTSIQSETDWVGLIYDFFSHDLKVSYDYHMCEAQRKKFVTQNKFTNKGIYFALKYFYEIKKGDWDKSHGGMGIVPFIYKESAQYWVAQENKHNGFLAAIEQQILERKNREVINLTQTKKKTKKKAKFSLDEVEGAEEW